NVAIDSLKRYCDNMKAQLNKMNIKFTTEYQISDLNMIEYTVIVWYLYA
ncbi:19113_t:CDS:1, partial [Gigaspora rosea]